MWFDVYTQGILIGLVASIQHGPIGLRCFQRTRSKSHRSGFVSGLGAATADSMFATVALFSLTVVMSFIENNMAIIKALGGISVVIVGVPIYLQTPVVQIRRNRAGMGHNLWGDYLSVFFLTLTNPAYILIFVALFAALGISHEGIPLGGGMSMILGVLCGASLWWFTLTFGVSILRRKFRPSHLQWKNRHTRSEIVVQGAGGKLAIFFHTPVVHEMLP